MFSEAATFTIDGQATYNGVFGSVLSVLITVLVMVYGLKRGILIYTYGDTTFQTSVERSNLNQTKIFSYDDTHFNIAIGIANEKGEVVPYEEYKRYISFETFSYTLSDNTVDSWLIEPIALTPCDQIDTDKFWPGID